MNKEIQLQDLGHKDYKDTWDYQETLFKEIVDIKLEKRTVPELVTPNFFLFVEHPHVYTLGKSGDMSNLLLSEKQLEAKGATFYKINRGGDITYHGPGQIVGYPILDLENFFTDIHKYLRFLEEALTPMAQIFLTNVVPTSNQTPVSPSLLVPESPYSANVRIITSSKKRKYLWISVKKFSKSRIG